MSITVRRRLACPMLIALGVVLTGCASLRPEPVRMAIAVCEDDLSGDGVIVTARGTRLALRPAPARLQRASLTEPAGSAVLTCKPDRGALTECVVLYEEPGGQGLGRLALGFADRVIYPSDVDDGVTAEVSFRFTASSLSANSCR